MIKYVRKHVKSQEYAWTGLVEMMRTQMNFDIELAIGMVSVIAGFYFKISIQEWIYLIICICSVLSAEMFNTALEHACDAITKDHNLHIKFAKDMGASAVLVTAIMALIIGLIIFIPKLMALGIVL